MCRPAAIFSCYSTSPSGYRRSAPHRQRLGQGSSWPQSKRAATRGVVSLAAGQHLLLGGSKFLVGEHAAGVQLGKLLQLLHCGRVGGGRRSGWWCILRRWRCILRRWRCILLLSLQFLELCLLVGQLLLGGSVLVGRLILLCPPLFLAMVNRAAVPATTAVAATPRTIPLPGRPRIIINSPLALTDFGSCPCEQSCPD